MPPGFDFERGRFSARTTLAIVAGTVVLCWTLYLYVSAESRVHQADMQDLRSGLALINAAMAKQQEANEQVARTVQMQLAAAREQSAAELKSLRDYLSMQVEFMARDQARLLSDQQRLETALQTALRDLRAEIKSANQGPRTPNDE